MGTRLPSAGLLIAIGLVVLWIGVTGRFDRLKQAWDYIRSDKTLDDFAKGTSGAINKVSTPKPTASIVPIVPITGGLT